MGTWEPHLSFALPVGHTWATHMFMYISTKPHLSFAVRFWLHLSHSIVYTHVNRAAFKIGLQTPWPHLNLAAWATFKPHSCLTFAVCHIWATLGLYTLQQNRFWASHLVLGHIWATQLLYIFYHAPNKKNVIHILTKPHWALHSILVATFEPRIVSHIRALQLVLGRICVTH